MNFLEVQNQGDVATEQILHVWYCCMSQLYIVRRSCDVPYLKPERAERFISTYKSAQSLNMVSKILQISTSGWKDGEEK